MNAHQLLAVDAQTPPPTIRRAGAASSIAQLALPLLPWIVICYGLATYFWYIHALFSMLEDDTLIVFRYAENFLHGHGWVMNPGEHVNGCTAPLHLMLITLLLWLTTPDNAVAALKLLGAAAGLLVLLLTYRIVEVLFTETRWPGTLAVFCLSVRPEFALSMTNGLETAFATLLLLLGTLTLMRADAQMRERPDLLPWGRYLWAGLAFAGATLERPELIPALPTLLLILLPGMPRNRQSASAASVLLAAWALPLAAWEVFSLWYYGDPLPNTFYAKHIPGFGVNPHGLSYIYAHLLPPLPLPFVLFQLGFSPDLQYWHMIPVWEIGVGVAALLCLIVGGGRYGRGVAAVLSLHVLFLLHTDGDWMVDGRFAVVVLPLAAVSWVAALFLVWRAACRLAVHTHGPWPQQVTRHTLPLMLSPLVGMFLLVGVVIDALPRAGAALGKHRLLQQVRDEGPVENASREAGTGQVRSDASSTLSSRWDIGVLGGNRIIADWINAHVAPGQTVLSSENGLIPFLCPKIRFIDIYGLTDRTISHLPGYQHSSIGVMGGGQWADPNTPLGRYITGRKPDWVILIYTDFVPNRTPGYQRLPALFTRLPGLDGESLSFNAWRRREPSVASTSATRHVLR